MGAPGAGLTIAYLHYGDQSGVTAAVLRALAERGHVVRPLRATGPLEFRNERGRRRVSGAALAQLGAAFARFGRRALAHRWNTPFAFDAHSRRAGELLDGLAAAPDLVLQNGGLFAPGRPPRLPYVLLLDHTRALSMALRAQGEGAPPAYDYGPGWRARELALYRGAAAIATFSRRVARSLQDDYGIAGARIGVVGAGANVFPHPLRREDDGRTILFVGRDFRRKGGPVLLRAFERLRRRRPGLRLLVAGPREGPALPDGARLLGPVPPAGLADLFARATVFALPTLREPFGLAFLDAMACGLPCVGTDLEAVPELVEPEVTGLLVPPGDAAALEQALDRLLADAPAARRMGLRGRHRVEERFRWSHVARRLERLLEQAAGEGPAAIAGDA